MLTCKFLRQCVKESTYACKAIDRHYIILKDIQQIDIFEDFEWDVDIISSCILDELYNFGFVNDWYSSIKLYNKNTNTYIFFSDLYLKGSFLDDKWDPLINNLKKEHPEYIFNWILYKYPIKIIGKPNIKIKDIHGLAFWKGGLIRIDVKIRELDMEPKNKKIKKFVHF